MSHLLGSSSEFLISYIFFFILRIYICFIFMISMSLFWCLFYPYRMSTFSFKSLNKLKSWPISANIYVNCGLTFFFSFWLCLACISPGPGIEPVPQQRPKPQQWQHQILNLLHQQETPGCISIDWFFSFWICMNMWRIVLLLCVSSYLLLCAWLWEGSSFN